MKDGGRKLGVLKTRKMNEDRRITKEILQKFTIRIDEVLYRQIQLFNATVVP